MQNGSKRLFARLSRLALVSSLDSGLWTLASILTVPFQQLPCQRHQGHGAEVVRPDPQVIQVVPLVVMGLPVDAGDMVEGDKVRILLDVFVGSHKNRVDGQAGEVHDPGPETLRQRLARPNAAPGDGVGIVVKLSHQQDLGLVVLDDDACEALNTLFQLFLLSGGVSIIIPLVQVVKQPLILFATGGRATISPT